eukprot:m.447272 g.447272  ORF g.447272 m.447272 type:complete len:155 (+) comp19497_c0_seq1:1219-1683(+)
MCYEFLGGVRVRKVDSSMDCKATSLTALGPTATADESPSATGTEGSPASTVTYSPESLGEEANAEADAGPAPLLCGIAAVSPSSTCSTNSATNAGAYCGVAADSTAMDRATELNPGGFASPSSSSTSTPSTLGWRTRICKSEWYDARQIGHLLA